MKPGRKPGLKLARFDAGQGAEIGVLADGAVIRSGLHSLNGLLRQDDPRGVLDAAVARGRSWPVDDVRLLPPQPRPGKMLFCGINYRSHLGENPEAVMPVEPSWFAKLPNTIVGPGEQIRRPGPQTRIDYEVELAVVIGRRARRVRRDDALDFVFGYTLVNDVSARDIQFDRSQLTLGKNPDTFCPMGPVLVLTDAMGPMVEEELTCEVNGQIRQRAFAAEMIFSIPVLLEHLTSVITLEPGDVVTTGTPAGVGCFMSPPSYLRPGDTVTVSATSIGSLTNTISEGAG